jgi:hypothetical protein
LRQFSPGIDQDLQTQDMNASPFHVLPGASSKRFQRNTHQGPVFWNRSRGSELSGDKESTMQEEFKPDSMPFNRPAPSQPERPEDIDAEELHSTAAESLPSSPLAIAQAKAQADMDMLKDELSLLRSRIAAIRSQTGAVVKAQRSSIDANARAQLGDYPWLKLAAASASAFIAMRAIRRLPMGLLAAMLAGAGRNR